MYYHVLQTCLCIVTCYKRVDILLCVTNVFMYYHVLQTCSCITEHVLQTCSRVKTFYKRVHDLPGVAASDQGELSRAIYNYI